MGLANETRQIGRHKYRVTQLPVGRGRQMLVRLTKALGPVLGRILEGGKLSEMDLQGISGALQELSSRLSEDDLNYACEVFGDSTEVLLDDGKKPQLSLSYQELHFAGRYGEMLKWLAFAVEVNYRDFFDVFGGLAGVPAEAAQPAA